MLVHAATAATFADIMIISIVIYGGRSTHRYPPMARAVRAVEGHDLLHRQKLPDGCWAAMLMNYST